MPDKKELGNVLIKYEGIFDWHELYSTIVSWLRTRKYDFYEDKHVKKPGTYGNELEYKATAEREETNYIRYKIEISIHGFHIEDVEVIENGEKKTKSKTGMITIEIKPTVDLDWKKNWENTEFQKKARGFVHKYIIPKNVEQWKGKLYYEAYQLQTKIKEVLNLEHKYSAY